MNHQTRSLPLGLSRLACYSLSFVLLLSTAPIGLFRNARAQNQRGPTQGTTLPPHYNLPSLGAIDELKKSDDSVKQPALKPSTSCGYRDKACKVKKDKEKKLGNLAPSNDVKNAYAASRMESKEKKSWLARVKNVFDESLAGLSFLSTANQFQTSMNNSKQHLINEDSRRNISGASTSAASGSSAMFLPPSFSSLENAKADPHNRVGKPGEDLFSGNYNFNLPLVSLPGRAGHDLNINLSYNSLIWTRYSNRMSFDTDYYPSLSPGFRTGFPELEGPYYINSANTYIAQMPSGERVFLRQIATNTFESIDSSYLYLKISATDLNNRTLFTTEGMQYKFEVPPAGIAAGVYWSRCTEIKDRNGNYISIIYKTIGDPSYPLLTIDKVIDTVGRQIIFEYDTNLHLIKISQNRNGQFYIYAQFEYGDRAIDPNFPTSGAGSVLVEGPDNGDLGPMVTKVITGDGARHRFVYNTWGQVDDIYLDGEDDQQRMGLDYSFPTSSMTDCPRFTQRRNYIKEWEGEGGANTGWATTTFAFDPDEAYGKYTGPDGVTYKEHFYTSLTGGKRGLPYRSEQCVNSNCQSGGIKQFTEYTWASDSVTGVPVRPRLTDIVVCDDRNGNGTYESGTNGDKKRRTTIDYEAYANTVKLPAYITEYQEGGATILRYKHILYEDLSNYVGPTRRIIGLPRSVSLYDGGNVLVSKTEYLYDSASDAGMSYLQQHTSGTQDARQHDKVGYGTGFTYRGNLIKTLTYSVTSGVASNPIEQRSEYFITGNIASVTQLRNTQLLKYQSFYDDSSNISIPSHSSSLPTFAYLTKSTDPDNGLAAPATQKYDYHLGAVTETVDPKSNKASLTVPPAKQVIIYDTKGRVQKIEVHKLNSSNSVVAYSHKRFSYALSHNVVTEYNTINSLAVETWTHHFLDGASRERITVSDFPSNPTNGTGHMKSAFVDFDIMGRIRFRSRPTQIGTNWLPTGDDSIYLTTSQTYDWKGRPLETTHPDPAQSKIIYSYGGCGCSGVNQVTRTDEVGRKTISYYDILGRIEKIDSYKANGTDVSVTEMFQYDVRDLTTERKLGDTTSNSFRTWTTMYDGYGRLWKSKEPEDETYSEISFNSDNTLNFKKDPRGVTTNYTYYNRPLVQSVEYTIPASPNFPILPSNNLKFEYDENGNRKKMQEKLTLSSPGNITETQYSYDELSRITSETKTFSGLFPLSTGGYPELPGTYTLSYTYNLASQPVRVDYTSSARPQDNFFFSHNYDNTGNVTGVVGSPLAGNSTYLSGIKYSAWGDSRKISFGHGGMEEYIYDEKMLIKDYRLTAPHETSGIQERMGAKYGYYPDGRLKTVESTEDSRFDRGYVYDDLGRLKNAFTDSMATSFRVNGTPPGPPGPFDVHPYNNTFEYNNWGQIINRAGKVWSIPDNRTQQYTAEGRRNGLDYDKTGNLINDGVNIYDYDAAGKSVGMRATFSNDASRSWYDGDGLLVCSNPFSTKKEIWIRSSVLGGAVIATIQAGTPGSSGTQYHVYAPIGAVLEQNIFIGNRLIAEQKYAYSTAGGSNRTSAFSWRHLKPLIGTESTIYSSTAAPAYAYAKVAERNADGINMGLSDPTQPPTVSPDYEIPSLSGNNPNGPPLVLIDGQPVELHLAQQYLRIGAGEVDWKNTGILAAIQLGIFGHWEAQYKYKYDSYNEELIKKHVGYRFVIDFFGDSPQRNTNQEPPSSLRTPYPCITALQLIQRDNVKNALNFAWDVSESTGKEAGGSIFYNPNQFGGLSIEFFSGGTRTSMGESEPKEFKQALSSNQREGGFWLADFHTHPSGNPEPSGMDRGQLQDKIAGQGTYPTPKLPGHRIGIVVYGKDKFSLYNPERGLIEPEYYPYNDRLNSCLPVSR